MNSEKEKFYTRVLWVDLLKFIGIFSIVFGHAVQNGKSNIYVYSFHVPLFFFVQGITFSMADIKKRTFSAYAKRRAGTLILPYALFSVISTVLIYIAFKFLDAEQESMFDSFSKLALNLLSGYCEANRPLWFLPCCFIISMLGYCVVALSEGINSIKYKKIVLCVVAVLGIVYAFLNDACLHIGKLFWKLDIVLPMMTFFIIGYIFQEFGIISHIMRIAKTKVITLAIPLLIVGMLLGLKNGHITYYGGVFNNVGLFYASAIMSIMGWCILCMILPKIESFVYVGKKTVSILLMHKFPILVFQNIITYTAVKLSQGSILTGIFVSIISITMCCIAHFVLERICPFAIGLQKLKTENTESISLVE